MTVNATPPGVLELAEAMRDGRLSSLSATQEYLSRIEQRNPALNAFIHVDAQAAVAAASASDSRRASGQSRSIIDGVPIALKDNIDVAGLPTSNGVGALRGEIARESAEVVDRLVAAGAVILGKVNMHEAALGATTDNPHFGACQHPLVAGDTPGGSSGGSAAAVAAGLCAAALGTDTLGSVRIPAAYCGTVGLLGSRGMVSRSGVCELSRTLDQVGVLARSVDDAAAVYAALCGYDARDEQSLADAVQFGEAVFESLPVAPGAAPVAPGTAAPKKLRLAVANVASDCDGPDAQAIVSRADAIIDRLGQLGHEITRVEPAVNYTELRRACLLVVEAEGYVACESWLNRDGVSEGLRKMLNYGARQPAERIERARAELRQARRAWLAVFDRHDLLLMPTAPQTSFAHGAAVPVSQADFTTPASVAGLPAISLPAGRTGGGRFLSLQIVGPARSELSLLAFARQMELLLASYLKPSLEGELHDV